MAADLRHRNDWGFSSRERNLFVALVSFGVVFLVLLALPALVRGGSSGESLASSGDLQASVESPIREVEVVMTDFAFEPASFEFEAGDRIAFVVQNQGKVPHEFRLTSGAAAGSHVEGGHDDHDDTGDTSSGDLWVLAGPGETKTLEVTFTPESTFNLVACLIPGHFEAGMSGPLSIAGSVTQAADHDDSDDHVDDRSSENADSSNDHDRTTEDADDSADHHDENASEGTDSADHDDSETTDHADSAEEHDEDPTDHDAQTAGSDDIGTVDRDIAVIMTEFAFEPSAIEVARGETIRFLLDNQGVIQHEFRLSTGHAVEEHIAAGHDDHGDEGANEGHGHGDVIVLVDGGETEAVVVTFDEDSEYDMVACLLPDHYEAGMWGTFTIAG